MAKRGRGCIVFTGGGLAFDPRGWPEGFSLSLGKAGVRGLAYSPHDAFKVASIRVGTVTVAGSIQEGTPFAPDLVAETYLKMFEGEPDPGLEIVFNGGSSPRLWTAVPLRIT